MDRTNHFFTDKTHNNSLGVNMRIVGSDSLKAMSDYELDRCYKDLKSQIYRVNDKLKKKFDRVLRQRLRELQIEHCYTIRELEVRENRKLAHEKYQSQKSR